MTASPLSPDQLRRRCDPQSLGFSTTEELEDLEETVGQPRAVAALRFGVGMKHKGYNLFCIGPEGLGKRTMVKELLEARAADAPTPPDLLYVNNFKEGHCPRRLVLPTGRGRAFKDDLEVTAQDLHATITAALETSEYKTRRGVIEAEIKSRHEEALASIHDLAVERGFTMKRTPVGVVFAPSEDGEILKGEELEALSEEAQQELMAVRQELEEAFSSFAADMPLWERERQSRLRKLAREVTSVAIHRVVDELREAHGDLEAVATFLDALEEDVVDHAMDFVRQRQEGEEQGQERGMTDPQANPLLRRYQANLLIGRQEGEGAPVVFETHPNYQNLIGRVEYLSRMGTLMTDFLLIRPGALHRANGGYLMLHARHLLMQPYAWEALKRCLRTRQIRVESLGQTLSLSQTVSLEPEPVELDVKVVLLGERRLYHALSTLDPDFRELFKVAVDFSEQMPWTDEETGRYVRLLATLSREEGLLPMSAGAIARILEQSAREVGHRGRLSCRVGRIIDLLREASFFAEGEGEAVTSAGSVERAIEERIYRSDRIRERLQEQIVEEVVLVDTEGAAVGQVNGLAVLQLGDFSFGKPSRITARVRPGKGQVLDIEREVDLGGPLHSKGVMILTSFLASRYAADRPLALSASLVFEQSYGGVDGDSASSAELYALLSSIAEVPLRQDVAVTGSVNQYGRVQAIGGVNQKIEGFYDLCAARGLTGEQGVLIPRSNLPHLMLRRDVVAAVAEGRFHVWAAATIDEGLALLTGLEAGARDAEGAWQEGSVNARVEARLREAAEAMAELARPRVDKG